MKTDWNTYQSIITNSSSSNTYYNTDRNEGLICYNFKTYLSSGEIIETTQEFETIEEAMMFEESFVKKPKVFKVLEFDKPNEVKVNINVEK